LHEGNLSQNITIVLADRYDYLAGDHRDNNLVILNASDLEAMIQEENSLFVTELITSVLSEELAHERGAEGDIATEQALAQACADDTMAFLGVQAAEGYVAFIERYGRELEEGNGYLGYLTENVNRYQGIRKSGLLRLASATLYETEQLSKDVIEEVAQIGPIDRELDRIVRQVVSTHSNIDRVEYIGREGMIDREGSLKAVSLEINSSGEKVIYLLHDYVVAGHSASLDRRRVELLPIILARGGLHFSRVFQAIISIVKRIVPSLEELLPYLIIRNRESVFVAYVFRALEQHSIKEYHNLSGYIAAPDLARGQEHMFFSRNDADFVILEVSHPRAEAYVSLPERNGRAQYAVFAKRRSNPARPFLLYQVHPDDYPLSDVYIEDVSIDGKHPLLIELEAARRALMERYEHERFSMAAFEEDIAYVESIEELIGLRASVDREALEYKDDKFIIYPYREPPLSQERLGYKEGVQHLIDIVQERRKGGRAVVVACFGWHSSGKTTLFDILNNANNGILAKGDVIRFPIKNYFVPGTEPLLGRIDQELAYAALEKLVEQNPGKVILIDGFTANYELTRRDSPFQGMEILNVLLDLDPKDIVKTQERRLSKRGPGYTSFRNRINHILIFPILWAAEREGYFDLIVRSSLAERGRLSELKDSLSDFYHWARNVLLWLRFRFWVIGSKYLPARLARSSKEHIFAQLYNYHPEYIATLLLDRPLEEIVDAFVHRLRGPYSLNENMQLILRDGQEVMLQADLDLFSDEGIISEAFSGKDLEIFGQHPVHLDYLFSVVNRLIARGATDEASDIFQNILDFTKGVHYVEERSLPTRRRLNPYDFREIDIGTLRPRFTPLYAIRFTNDPPEEQDGRLILPSKRAGGLSHTSHWTANGLEDEPEVRLHGKRYAIIVPLRDLIAANRGNFVGGNEGDLIFYTPLSMPDSVQVIERETGRSLREQVRERLEGVAHLFTVLLGRRWDASEIARSKFRRTILNNGLFYGSHGDHWSVKFRELYDDNWLRLVYDALSENYRTRQDQIFLEDASTFIPRHPNSSGYFYRWYNHPAVLTYLFKPGMSFDEYRMAVLTYIYNTVPNLERPYFQDYVQHYFPRFSEGFSPENIGMLSEIDKLTLYAFDIIFRSPHSAHFSLRSKSNSLTKQGTPTTERFSVAGKEYDVN
ncbi:hypothetical protein ACFL0P_07735, partial [Candidatus Omnitrophota bacterium]